MKKFNVTVNGTAYDVEVNEVNDTVRGEGGFGSTGTTINTK